MRETLQQALRGPPGLETLAALVDALRPPRRAAPEARLRAAVEALEAEPELAAALRARLADALADRRFVYVLVESGILGDRGVGDIVWSGIAGAVLPPVYPAYDARSAVPRIFRRRGDWRWVGAIDPELWARLLQTVLREGDLGRPLHADVAGAIRVLAQRIAGSGTDVEIEAKLAFVAYDDSPFLELPLAADALLGARERGEDPDARARELRDAARACRDIVRRLRDDKDVHGTSLRLTRLTRRMDQQLRRLELLARLAHPQTQAQLAHSLARLLARLLEAEQAGQRIGRRLEQSVDLLALQIIEHTAAKSAKYIGATRRDYRKLFVAACGGGAIIGVFAILKVLGGKLELSLAARALLYGLNYAACFVVVYLAGATIATKQPAVTASAIVKQLDESETRQRGLEGVAETMVVVWRSQFVSFLGNLLFACPAAYLFALAGERLLGFTAVTEERAADLLAQNHPWESGALFYAAIAGVFLFVSGLVQGAVDNRVVYTRLRERLARHPRLAWLGRARLRAAGLVTAHAGGLASNVVLGFLLGSAGIVGKILGLPIAIRHIAFSSAHVGVALLDAPHLVDLRDAGVLTLGVLGIGFVNFLVSFGLTLALTLKSRQVTLTQGGALLGILAARFRESPLAWFFPVAAPQAPPDPPTER